jgi:NAD+ kinase
VHRIGLVVHSGRAEARDAGGAVRTWCTEHAVSCMDLDVWDEPRRHSRDEVSAVGRLDLVVTIGGDGTFLRGVRVAVAADCPVMGVNVGRVGFLTDVRPEDTRRALDQVRAGSVRVEERLTLTLRASRPLSIPPGLDTLLKYGRGPSLPPPPVRDNSTAAVGWGVALDVTAVNDVVFEKLSRDRQASLGIYLGSRLFASYSADAVIVGSPTGSTAYSFAAGGPVLSPYLDAVIFTPVAPHMVFDRSIVLSAEEVIGVRVLDRSGQVAVSVDGQLRGVLDPGDWVGVYAASKRAKLLRFGEGDFYDRLRGRFSLADAPAAAADNQGGAPLVYRPSDPVPPDLAHLRLPPVEPIGDGNVGGGDIFLPDPGN